MKSDEEFISSMWSLISAKELEAEQKLISQKLNRRLFIKEIIIYGIIAVLLAIGCLINFFVKDNLVINYSVALFLLCAAFYTEEFNYLKSQEVTESENGNCYK